MALRWYEWVGLLVLLVGMSIYGNAEPGDNNPFYFIVMVLGSGMILYGWFLWRNKRKKKKLSLGKKILYIIATIFLILGMLNIILPAILSLLA